VWVFLFLTGPAQSQAVPSILHDTFMHVYFITDDASKDRVRVLSEDVIKVLTRRDGIEKVLAKRQRLKNVVTDIYR
jgi:hypothetical protein